MNLRLATNGSPCHNRLLARAGFLAGLLCFLALAVGPRCLAEAPAPPAKIVTIEGITEYRLDNGLRILLFRDDSSATVTVALTVLVGSRHEGYGEAGMAHLLEHLQFKGTPTFPDIPKVLKEHGALFNATTGVDRTKYFETLPATADNLAFALHLEADRLVNSYIRAADLKSEMTVVRNEFEMGENNPEYILSQRMLACAYEWHNYGKTTIGNKSDIERVPIKRLQAFYHKYYRPDNSLLVVGGKCNEAQALADIAKYFGVLQRPAQKLDTTYTEEPPQDGERSVTLRRVGKVARAGVVYHIPAAAEADYPAVYILNSVLVAEPSGRLYKALVEGKKAARISGFAYDWHDPGVLEITAEVGQSNKLPEVRDSLIHLLEDPAQHDYTAQEVERAKQQFKSQRERLMANSRALAMQLGEWDAKGDWRLFFIERDRIAQVTLQDVIRVANRYLLRSNRTSGLFIPTDKPVRAVIPATPAMAGLVQDYRGGQGIASGEAFDPTPANIEKRVQRTQLPIGLKIALLPKKTRGQTVVAELTLRYGNEHALKGHTTAVEFLATLMTRGTKHHTRQQIHDELIRLGARISPADSLGAATFTVQAKRQNFVEVLRLLGEMLREPTFPEQEFDVLKRGRRENLEKGLTEPTALAFRSLRRKLNPYPKDNIRYVPTISESIERLQAVTVDEVRQLYADQLGAQVGELAVVGDFDPAATLKEAERILNDWKAQIPYQRVASPAKTGVPGGLKVILTPDKKNAVYMAGEMLALTDADPDYPALEIGNFLFGGGTLSSRLGNRVRQKEGLSYGVRSQFVADALDKRAAFSMFAICNPANIDKVDKAIREELDRLLKDGVGDHEVAEAKRSFLQREKVQRANDGFVALTLAEELFEGRSFAYDAHLDSQIESLTPEEITRALRKHIDPNRVVIIRAGDFRK